MPGLIEKIVLTVGSAFLAGALLVVAYISGGAAVLAFILSGIFLIGGGVVPVVREVFAPIGFAAAVIFALSTWALAGLGVGAWWIWKKKAPGDPNPPGA